jgi:hypothetical protein
MLTHALVLQPPNAHAETCAHLKNVACNEKLTILVLHELMLMLHLLLQQDLALLLHVVLLMRVVADQPIIGILLLVKMKVRRLANHPQHLPLAKQHLLARLQETTMLVV